MPRPHTIEILRRQLKRYSLSLAVCLFCLISVQSPAFAQTGKPLSDREIAQLVEQFKADQRGPYRDIRWFCADGTTVAPSERCPTPGVQRARYKDSVISLGRTNHVFLGQILSTTDFDAFWDSANGHSRLKQYQLENYLRQIDNGWVNRRAQTYRGAYQAEDEDAWGIAFLTRIVKNDQNLIQNFFLVRQASNDIPHRVDDNLTQRIRTVSKEISDAHPAFLDLRVKIHGQPEASDIGRVRQFKEQSRSLPNNISRKLDSLLADMTQLYSASSYADLIASINRLRSSSPLTTELQQFASSASNSTNKLEQAQTLADEGLYIREQILEERNPSERLALIDLSIRIENILYANLSEWSATSLRDELDRIELLTVAAAAFGFIEVWEFDEAVSELETLRQQNKSGELNLSRLVSYLAQARRIVEWGSLTVHATYEDVVTLFTGFEPLSAGFYDVKIRSSVLLPLGESVGRLGDVVAKEAGFSNQLFNIPNGGQARGLNPGYAKGVLQVVSGSSEGIEIDASKIYAFHRPPADLKPVAGILTVTEGNLVSHVQLLARNLGIPNGVVSAGNLADLAAYDGREVFLAVSNNGTVILKEAGKMSRQERELFTVRQRATEKIFVPVERMDLSVTSVLNLSSVNATHSGRVTGPKAANLGQLKKMFPENVVDGIVIPFGIFRQHMDQTMPGSRKSYWETLTDAFAQADKMRAQGASETAVEQYILGELEKIRTAIKSIELLPSFGRDFETQFTTILGGRPGSIPVFVRSDTNMEDLKDFTGAGLNLTLFNVVESEKIQQGIKDVWASPYSERSFKWRQKYLRNPENVYPSILIIPSVDADKSGVLITKGVEGGNENDITVAFNRGVGGAVDGQAAESWLLTENGRSILLAPSRELGFTAIPATGGTKKARTTLESPILSARNLADLRKLSVAVEDRLPKSPGVDTRGPFDVELGFKNDKIWLFQVRPFVENKQAQSTDYLLQISPSIPAGKKVPLTRSIP